MADFIFADQYVLEDGRTRRFHDTFLKGLVHKSNNLTGAIQGFGSLILLEENASGDLLENARQIDAAARLSSELYKKVLTAGGCARVDCVETSLDDMLGFLEEKARDICKQQEISCSFQTSENLPPVITDTAKLSEIFSELIRNAAEAAAETSGESVEVEIVPPGEKTSSGRVDLFIRNRSVDIPSHRIPDLFEGFFSSKGNEHFGLGLTTAAVLCGQMDTQLGLKCDSGVMTAWLAIPTPS